MQTGMKTTLAALACPFALILGSTLTCFAPIFDLKRVDIDFTNPADAAQKATWSGKDHLTVSKEGLGVDGGATSLGSGWVQTKPLALGLSWRPAYGFGVRVTIQPPPLEVSLHGQKWTPSPAEVFIRYSPDNLHWSSWQALAPAETRTEAEKKTPALYYGGIVSVPNRERMEYEKLVSDYSELDVPWKSDEEAAVRWILGRDPAFFSTNLPFAGYVEFLMEAAFQGGQRIKVFKAEIAYGLGGMSTPPRDPDAARDRDVTPWRFEAKVGARHESGAPQNDEPHRR